MECSLPENWMVAELGEVLDDIVGGGTPPKEVPEYFQGNIPLMTVKDMKVPRPRETGFNITEQALKKSSSRIVPADTVIIATRMGLGKVVRPIMPTAINQDLKAIFPSEALNKSYLEQWLISIAHEIEAMGTGTTVKGVRLNQIRALQVPLAPLEEQRRIVERIEMLFSQLDAGEAALRQMQQQLARYRQSVLKAAVTGVLTADWRAQNAHRLEHGRDLLARILQTRRENWQGRGQYKEPAAPDTSDLPELPQGWVWVNTEQLVFVETGATPKKGILEFYQDGAIPWITSTAVNDDLILSGQDLITEEAIRRTNAKIFPIGSLIVALYGEGRTRGMVSELGIEAATNQACAALLVGHLPQIITVHLKNFYKYNYENIRLLSSGGVQPNLNLGVIKDTKIPLPSAAEIEEISGRISTAMQQIDVLEKACQAELTRSAALRQSILKDAFAGKLAPQDPNDEPAGELLARIRATRAESASPKRRGRTARS